MRAGQGDGDSEDGLVARRLAPYGGRTGRASPEYAGAEAAAPPFPDVVGARGIRFAGIAHRLPVAPHTLPRAALEPERAPGLPAALRAGNAGQSIRAGACCPAAAGPLLHRLDAHGVPARALPAGRRAGPLLQRHEVPLLLSDAG